MAEAFCGCVIFAPFRPNGLSVAEAETKNCSSWLTPLNEKGLSLAYAQQPNPADFNGAQRHASIGGAIIGRGLISIGIYLALCFVLSFVCMLDLDAALKAHRYSSASHVKRVKAVYDALVADLDAPWSVEELARRYDCCLRCPRRVSRACTVCRPRT